MKQYLVKRRTFEPGKFNPWNRRQVKYHPFPTPPGQRGFSLPGNWLLT